MHRRRSISAIAFVLISAFVVGGSVLADGAAVVVLRLRFQDSRTGAGIVPDSLLVDGKEMASGVKPSGRIDLQVKEGEHSVSVKANGYRELSARETAVEGDTPLNVLLLDPVTPPSGLDPAILGLFWQPNSATLAGYVMDDATGEPLAGADVAVAGAGVIAVTDSDGFFVLTVAMDDGAPLPGDEHGGLFAKKTLSISKAGYVTQIWQEVLAVSGDSHVSQYRLSAGQGMDVMNEQDSRGRLLGNLFDGRPPVNETKLAGPALSIVENQATPELLSQTGPTSIRVGRNCPTKTTCTTVQTMSMDTYVKHVLPAEWYASWNAESLKAGAVAIRSYGGWHVYHPLGTTYDICDTAACQVYKDTTSPSADAAVDATAGIYVVDSSGNIARSEYSAENNNSGTCGDCYIINNPATACLSDSVCCGATLNGHGRGMCQWGTQRWATTQGKTYTWIVDHYYANFGWTRQNLGGPVITQQPVPQSVCSGATTTFTVAATGSGTLTYQWQKNDANLSTGGHYTGVTTATLTVSGASIADVASYRCVVHDSAGATNSNEAALTLRAATSITQQPVASNVCPGGTATFTVTATGDGSLSYQWRKDGGDLSNGGHYSGVTAATLTVSDANGADAGSYGCVVNGGCGSAASTPAALTVLAATAITQQPQDRTVSPGGSATFSVSAEGQGAVAFQWQRGGADLSDGGHYTGAALATLTVSGVGTAEEGRYYCVVTAGCGTVISAEAALVLQVAVADFDKDGDVDLDDFTFFRMCFSGPNRSILYPECQPADADGDADVDLADFAVFRGCFNGPNRPPQAGCPQR